MKLTIFTLLVCLSLTQAFGWWVRRFPLGRNAGYERRSDSVWRKVQDQQDQGIEKKHTQSVMERRKVQDQQDQGIEKKRTQNVMGRRKCRLRIRNKLRKVMNGVKEKGVTKEFPKKVQIKKSKIQENLQIVATPKPFYGYQKKDKSQENPIVPVVAKEPVEMINEPKQHTKKEHGAEVVSTPVAPEIPPIAEGNVKKAKVMEQPTEEDSKDDEQDVLGRRF